MQVADGHGSGLDSCQGAGAVSPLSQTAKLAKTKAALPPLVDSHLHLSLGRPELNERHAAQRHASWLGKLCLDQNLTKLWEIQQSEVTSLLELLQRYPELQLHVQSTSYVDSVFNYALLTHPQLRPYLKRSLFLYVGLHPWFIAPEMPEAQTELNLLKTLIGQLQHQQVLTGIGEIGLDKTPHAAANLAVQSAVLQDLLETNQQLWHLPLSLHCCKAHNELLVLLSKVSPQNRPLSNQQQAIQPIQKFTGAIHGFNSSLPIAQRYVSLGLKLGLGLTWAHPNKQAKLQQLLELTTVAATGAAAKDGEGWFCLETDFDQGHYTVEPLRELRTYIGSLLQA